MNRAVLLEPLSNMVDSSSLSKHGDVVVMFTGYGANAAPSVFKTEEFDSAIRRWLGANHYDPENDVFVVAGRLTKVAIALSTIREHYAGRRVRVMIFDGSCQAYVERTI